MKAFALKLVKEESINYEVVGKKVTEPKSIYRIAIDGLNINEEPAEIFGMFTLNTKNQITGYMEVSRGTLNASIVHPRDVYSRALLQNANSIILMHNHPSGDPTPSKEDISITNRLAEVGEILGIKVLDHIIIGDNRYISLKEKNFI